MNASMFFIVFIAWIISLLTLFLSYQVLRFFHLDNVITRIIAWGITSVSIFYCIYFLFHLNNNDNQNVTNIFALISFIMVACSFSLYIIKKIFLSFPTKTLEYIKAVTKNFLIFLKKYHNFFGWLVLLTSTAHGIYFINKLSNFRFKIFTGVITWIILIAVALLGFYIDYRKNRQIYSPRTKLFHMVIALFFIFLLIFHMM